MNLSISLKHVPPFLHGLFAQKLSFVSQLFNFPKFYTLSKKFAILLLFPGETGLTGAFKANRIIAKTTLAVNTTRFY